MGWVNLKGSLAEGAYERVEDFFLSFTRVLLTGHGDGVHKMNGASYRFGTV